MCLDEQEVDDACRLLKQLIVSGHGVEHALDVVCHEFYLPRKLVKVRCERREGRTLEELAETKIVDVSLHNAICAATSKWVKGPEPCFVGRRFFLDFKSRKWFRFIGYAYHWLEAIDEETCDFVRWEYPGEIWPKIQAQLIKAAPYEREHEIIFSGSDPDRRKRERILSTIRLALSEDFQSGDDQLRDQLWKALDERLKAAPSLTHIYQSLTTSQQEEVDYQTRNPAARLRSKEGDADIASLLELLARLKNGEMIANPIAERPMSWREQLEQ